MNNATLPLKKWTLLKDENFVSRNIKSIILQLASFKYFVPLQRYIDTCNKVDSLLYTVQYQIQSLRFLF